LCLGTGSAGHVSAALPEGWSNRDIGTTGGSASEIQGTWTVRGDGADVWGHSDAFHFVYRTLSGNGEITARAVSPTQSPANSVTDLVCQNSSGLLNTTFPNAICSGVPGGGN
jgi:hypothetical protein